MYVKFSKIQKIELEIKTKINLHLRIFISGLGKHF
jgi:hypothetical protein